MKFNPLPSQERLKEVLTYDPDTGVFTWKISSARRIKAGDIAGTLHSEGYIKISINGKRYLAHRLAWLYMTGDDPGDRMLDHKNQVKTDNAFSNLRFATDSQNQQNKQNVGFSFHKATHKWEANLTHNGERKYLGLFDCPLLARLAYLDARKQYFGEFA